MRVSLVVVIIAMAALGLGLTVVSGRIYGNHAIDNERTALTGQLGVAMGNVRYRLDNETELLARVLGEQPILANGSIIPQHDLLQKALEKLFHYSATDAGPAIVGLAIYDAGLEPLVQRSFFRPDAEANEWQAACEYLRAALTRRTGDAPPPSSVGYCLAGSRLYYSANIPIGDPFAGYLEITIDAVPEFAALEHVLNLPLQISLSDGSVIFQSPSWTDSGASGLSGGQNLEVRGPAPLVVEVAKDERAFYAKLEQTRYAVLFAAVAVTLLFALIALSLLHTTATAPLRSLRDQLRRLQRDESQPGKRVTVNGSAEVVELAGRFNEMTVKLEGLYENIERMAFTDPLTQLPNRSRLQDRLEHAAAAARRDNKTFSLFMMDLDRFKEINNTLGHHIGDLLLQQVAIRLRAKLRESDTIARTGGDEFAVVLPTVTPKQADMAARMLLQTVQAPFVVGAHYLDIRTSIGIALCPDHGVDAHTLIQRADMAMYAAKQADAGHMFYDPQMDQHNPAQLVLMSELRQAVEQEQFVLYYQPKIGLKTNRVVGLEALVRWRHPNGKLVMPETFISLLEQTGLIRGLTEWVTREALRTVCHLRDRGVELPIAVNISARDLHKSGLAEELAEQLAVHQASAEWLELEITEGAIMADVARAMDVLAQLAEGGFKLVIDDFGTGYSSLAYLKRLPVQAVKIDKSFVIGMAKDHNDAAIVYTSIDLLHSLGMQVIAEGVDDEGVLMRLRSRGCDAAQGIYLSRPLPAEDLADWLTKSSWGLPVQAVS